MSDGIKHKICHGNKKRHKTKQKHLPRNDTEKHGNKIKQKQDTEIRISRRICHGRKAHLSEPDASATVVFISSR